MLVRTENRGDTNSAEDWELLAKTVGGDSYTAKLVEMRGPISEKVRPTEGTEDHFTFYPSDQIHLKTANPMPKGKLYWGFALFAFDDLPLSTLHLPGTVFTLRCKDVVTQRRAQSTLIWRGKDDEWRIFPGMNNVPLPEQPTPVPTAMPLASK